MRVLRIAGAMLKVTLVSTTAAAQNAIAGHSICTARTCCRVFVDGTILNRSFWLNQPRSRPEAAPIKPRSRSSEITC
jgi:hypothetical protein